MINETVFLIETNDDPLGCVSAFAKVHVTSDEEAVRVEIDPMNSDTERASVEVKVVEGKISVTLFHQDDGCLIYDLMPNKKWEIAGE